MSILSYIYSNLTPKFIRDRILWLNIGQMRKQEKDVQKSLPYINLEARHLKNLIILPSRDVLLEKMPKHAIVAELGVDQGEFSRQILFVCSPKKLHLIDYWGDEKYNENTMVIALDKVKEAIQLKQVMVHRGMSYLEMNKFDDNYFDWVYIDTDHTYITTKKELEICSQKVKKEGIISGHDYVTKCYTYSTRYGVIEAVNEFCVKNDWEFVYLTHETDRHLSYAIRRIQVT